MKTNQSNHKIIVHTKMKDNLYKPCETKYIQNGKLRRHIIIVHVNVKETLCEQCDLQLPNLNKHSTKEHWPRFSFNLSFLGIETKN